MNCKCIEKTNEALKEFNAQLCTMMVMNEGVMKQTIMLDLRRAGKGRKKMDNLAILYCPICGTPTKRQTIDDRENDA